MSESLAAMIALLALLVLVSTKAASDLARVYGNLEQRVTRRTRALAAQSIFDATGGYNLMFLIIGSGD